MSELREAAIERAYRQDKERTEQLVERLRALIELPETPELRRESREIHAEMDAPGALERISRADTSDAEEEHAARADSRRARRQRQGWLQQDLDDGLITQEQFDDQYDE